MLSGCKASTTKRYKRYYRRLVVVVKGFPPLVRLRTRFFLNKIHIYFESTLWREEGLQMWSEMIFPIVSGFQTEECNVAKGVLKMGPWQSVHIISPVSEHLRCQSYVNKWWVMLGWVGLNSVPNPAGGRPPRYELSHRHKTSELRRGGGWRNNTS